MIFYETPHRLRATLQDMRAAFGERPASLSRELTKHYEETTRGSLSELVDHAARHKQRGEYVIVVAGTAPRTNRAFDADEPDDEHEVELHE